jgi:hypothetical protein
MQRVDPKVQLVTCENGTTSIEGYLGIISRPAGHYELSLLSIFRVLNGVYVNKRSEWPAQKPDVIFGCFKESIH